MWLYRSSFLFPKGSSSPHWDSHSTYRRFLYVCNILTAGNEFYLPEHVLICVYLGAVLRFTTLRELLMGDQPPGLRGGAFPENPEGAKSNISPLTSASSNVDPKKAQRSMHQSENSRTRYSPSQAFHSQQHDTQQSSDAFMLAGLAGALPDISHHNYGNFLHQRQMPNQSPGVIYPMQNIGQYGGSQAPNPAMANMPYTALYQGQLQGMFPTDQAPQPQQLHPGASGGHNFLGGYMTQHQQPNAQYFIPPHQYGSQDQIYSRNSAAAQDGTRHTFSGGSRQQLGSESMRASPSSGGPARSSSTGISSIPLYETVFSHKYLASSPGKSSVVRGPPRKPRQSGKLPMEPMDK